MTWQSIGRRSALPSLAVVLVGLVLLAGGIGPVKAEGSAEMGTTPRSSEGANEVPDAVVQDVKTGESVNLRALIPAQVPILFWFYAPH